MGITSHYKSRLHISKRIVFFSKKKRNHKMCSKTTCAVFLLGVAMVVGNVMKRDTEENDLKRAKMPQLDSLGGGVLGKKQAEPNKENDLKRAKMPQLDSLGGGVLGKKQAEPNKENDLKRAKMPQLDSLGG